MILEDLFPLIPFQRSFNLYLRLALREPRRYLRETTCLLLLARSLVLPVTVRTMDLLSRPPTSGFLWVSPGQRLPRKLQTSFSWTITLLRLSGVDASTMLFVSSCNSRYRPTLPPLSSPSPPPSPRRRRPSSLPFNFSGSAATDPASESLLDRKPDTRELGLGVGIA